MSKKIAVLGCGWLGLPLAIRLVDLGYTVHGSTTSPEKLKVLLSKGIVPFHIRITEEGIDETHTFLKSAQTLIVNIPPGLRGKKTGNYVAKIRHLVTALKDTSIQNVLFISSTSVYGDSKEVITEKTNLRPQTESGKQLAEAENLLQCEPFKTTVLRFGGLIGPERHPVTHLSGKTDLPNPDSPVNLIHLDDCIGVIETILTKNVWDTIINAVYPNHPTRKEYYTVMAQKKALPVPLFVPGNQATGKIIRPQYLLENLGYSFKRDIHL
ncbi:SDR family oxidoreductase [Ascidiimonas aurantiaca]|uniref:SDR family oxidoreductase n=1 Tax=Ascidiimonas aurantiaca TaxID=1685432 RepID=UPI0030ED7238